MPDFWTLSAWGLSAVGVLLAVYFWFNPRQIIGQLRYAILPTDAERSFLLKRWWSYADALYIDIWNPSKAGADGADIWEPVSLTFDAALEISGATIEDTKQVNPDTIALNIKDNKLYIRWKYLDSGMAFRIKVSVHRDYKKALDFDRTKEPLISCRIKGFKMKEPFNISQLPEYFSTAFIMISVYAASSLVWYAILYALFYFYPNWAAVDIAILSPIVSAASILTLVAVLFAGSRFEGLPGRLFNTRSPFQTQTYKML